MNVVFHIVAAAALVVIGLTVVYVFSLTVLGMRVSRRAGVRMKAHEGQINEAPRDAGDRGFVTYFLVPCFNEEAVVGATIEGLLGLGASARILIINDGSADRTGDIAESYGDRVSVLHRVLPDARKGKGAALNAGLQQVRALAAAAGIETRKVLVCVMDADGQLTPNALEAVEPVFDDPAVGGVQLVVRIRNRDSMVLRFQDMEFWAMSGVGQLGRMTTNTVSMGGNGQFTRLFALDEIGVNPWSDSLTEDLDLGISLSALGWKTTSTAGAYVTQQGVDDFEVLIRQRTRWYQGHMQSMKRFPDLMRSKYLSNAGFFELSAYLAVPWLITLPWSIIQQFLLYEAVTGRGQFLSVLHSTSSVPERVAYVLAWYLISFAPHLFWGWLYWRRAEEVTIRRALLMCHMMIPWSYLSYAAAWRALGRIILRRNTWAKTARTVEPSRASLSS